MQKFRGIIERTLKKELKLEDVKIEVPPSSELGDFAFPCFELSRTLKKNPVEIAKNLSEKLKIKDIEIKATGPYVNFFIKKDTLLKNVLEKISTEKENFGKQKNKSKKIIIEYPSPNTNKPLHLGHVRNMCLGQAFSRILEANGNKVISVNLNNDRGIHICKSMLAYKKFGKNDSPEKSKMKSDFFVGKYYVLYAQKVKETPKLEEEAQEMLEKWESGDKETLELWKKMNKWAFDGFKETYKTFGLKFEKEYYENQTYKKGKDIVLEGLKKGVFFKNNEGAVVVDLNEQGYGEKVLLRPNGTTVYVTQDLYLAKLKYDDFKYDKSIYVVATEQNYHFKVLFEILKILKFPFAGKCHHLAYGMVNLTTGKMKSREGTVVDADILVSDMIELAKKETKKRHPKISSAQLEKRAKQIAMGAIRFYLLKYDTIKDITFDQKKSISFEGETGPYVQYVHARICSIIKKYGKKIDDKIDHSLLKEKEEKDIVSILSKFPEVIENSEKNYKPSLIANYLLELSQKFNEYYHKVPILQADDKVKKARLFLIDCVKQVVKNGLCILGIESPEKM